MMDDLYCPGRLKGMGVFGLMKEAVKLMRQNVSLFLSFVTSFTIPCSIFTVFLFSAVDVHRRYVIDDFISKGELMILGWKIETMISPSGLHFVFIILNLLPMALLNTVVCTRGVVRIYKNEDLATSMKNSYIDLHWPVLRLIATQFLIYCVLVILVAFFLLPDSSSGTPSYIASIISVLRWVFAGGYVLLLYPIAASQVTILERRNFGFRGVSRAMELAYSRSSTTLRLAFFSLSYLVLLKLLVDVLLKQSYPLWIRFLVYPPLVISVIAMSIFWPVVYTLFYLSCNIDVSLGVSPIQPAAETKGPEIDVHQPLLADEVERNDDSSNKHMEV